MALEDIAVLQDGIAGSWIQEVVSGVRTGPMYKIGGMETLDNTRNTAERTLPGDNLNYREDEKFLSNQIAAAFWGLPPELIEYFLGGTLIKMGSRIVFREEPSKTPKSFALFVKSDAVGEGNEDRRFGEFYPELTASNLQNPKTSGEFVSFQATLTGTTDARGVSREWEWTDGAEAFELTAGATPPALPTAVPAEGATGVAVASDITLTFAENMDNASAQAIELWNLDTNTQHAATVSVVTTVITINPDTDLDAATRYALDVPPSVETALGAKLAKGIALIFTTA